MKRLFVFLFLSTFLFFTAIAQHKISGKVFDDSDNPLVGAIVIINNGKLYSSTDQFGYYEFKNLSSGKYTIKVKYIGFVKESKTFVLSKDTKINFQLKPNELNELDEVVVKATRAAGNTPIAYTNIQASDIKKHNVGQDIPFILKSTPSLITTSDAGTGIGYTQMRIRGTDVSRINVTLNGVPLNNPESHGVWWVDIPDFASSVDNIQIQRGVGTSTNGAGAFGATINLKTNKLNTNPYATIINGYGSFNTLKNTVKFGTGSINEHFFFDGRLSRLSSDGYIDRAWSELKSYYVSGAYFDSKTLIKATIFSGLEETYQAWSGVPKHMLDTNRTYNPYTYENEIDHYLQTHYQLRAVRKFTENLHLDISGFYIKGAGYYEQYKEDQNYQNYGLEEVTIGDTTLQSTDLIRRKWLDNDFYGIVYNLIFNKDKLNIVFGGGWNKYDGGHFGNIIWMDFARNTNIRHQWYNNDGIKTDLNNFLKINYDFMETLNFFGDFQYRVIDYSINGIDDDLSNISQQHKYNFINPKVGLFFHPNNYLNVYLSFAKGKKEPKRTDFIDAPENNIPKPETLYDYELGYKLALDKVAFEANLYYMDYKNQLILTGEINDVGTPIVTNTPKSFRRGIELIFRTRLFNRIDWNANVTLSQNKVENFTEYVDNWDYWEDPENEPLQIENHLGQTDLSFSPSIIANNEISVKITKFLNISLINKYVSRQYIDNTSSLERSIDPYFINDILIITNFETQWLKNIEFSAKINNVLNEKYETSAWVYSYYLNGQRENMNGYFPQAGTNFMLNLTLKF